MRGPTHGLATRSRRACAVALCTAGLLLVPTAAWAHGGGDEPTEGYLLVQQALGYLAHEGDAGVDMAMDKVGDTLSAPDQEGVDLGLVQQAKASLERDDVTAAQAELNSSISAAVSGMAPAVGENTGTSVVPSDLPGRGPLSVLDDVFLGVSGLLVLVGGGLALRFRPADRIAALRARLSVSAPIQPHGI